MTKSLRAAENSRWSPAGSRVICRGSEAEEEGEEEEEKEWRGEEEEKRKGGATLRCSLGMAGSYHTATGSITSSSYAPPGA